MFVDTATLHIESGKGGDGCLSFRREKFIPKGGPDGGHGGRGGHVIFRATFHVNTLLHFRHQSRLKAQAGQAGMGSRRHGADGEDLLVSVPIGTIVRDAETGELIADFSEDEQEVILASGGRGGLGNEFFKSSTNRAPRKTTKGKPGEERELDIELKLLADVGLLGMPNAGKSTLISRISASRPKIADYPFTTLEPNLGVVDLGGYHSCVVADIPGIIPGAHAGKGLGARFLRHVDRCSLLLHLVDASVPLDHALADMDAISKELELFSPDLALKPRLAVMTKLDVTEAKEQIEALQAGIESRGYEVLGISSVSGFGLQALIGCLSRALLEQEENSKDLEAGSSAGGTASEDAADNGEGAQAP
ncbi:MAG: GTPase ObgE [Nitrospinaceae bacterium]|jgi:GTPase|nr:GTPase ObgE [Nitrospinaceae bacterium]MBT3435219.1 GTPase ObgE [Nitrospinaceae bacterium]MBT4094485.1 GTPase ObgE [Nitrospinaceae bacterium]MBT4429180.1 GTPase ObgE [Nitrospinaceae bacterium]MBT5948178.1 GTPase ObgE [Nitrospinaceae bacterium]